MVKFKQILLDIYTFPILSKERENYYQKKARDAEWKIIKKYIPKYSSFIDVGCGAGYYLEKAKVELGCAVVGIDPMPGDHGVNRYKDDYYSKLNIQEGSAENLPFKNDQFDVVFCSHVLEHVNEISKSLKEMKRVCNSDGIVIIGVPSSRMACISLFTQLLLTTHIRLVNYFMQQFIKTGKIRFKQVFFGYSHSYPDTKTTLYDIRQYKTKVWRSFIEKYFIINKVVYPALYPYPNYIQLFKLKKRKNTGSSIFFICNPM